VGQTEPSQCTKKHTEERPETEGNDEKKEKEQGSKAVSTSVSSSEAGVAQSVQ
jgi:hypothetical protein